MTNDGEEFCLRVEAILRRFAVQNEQPAPAPSALRAISERLWALVLERGLPRPLASHERGAPGSMSDAETAPIVARAMGDAAGDAVLEDAVRQLVKTCFYPEFKTCRESFRAISPDGCCRRQELPRALRRVSGAHCVDCPHWVGLSTEMHRQFLAQQWYAGADAFIAHRDIFLPEDFRALRTWLHAAARRSLTSA